MLRESKRKIENGYLGACRGKYYVRNYGIRSLHARGCCIWDNVFMLRFGKRLYDSGYFKVEKQMKNKLTVILVLFATMLTPMAHAGAKWYFGVGAGTSALSLDVNGLISKSVDKRANNLHAEYIAKINAKLAENDLNTNYILPPINVGTVKNRINLAEEFNQDAYNFYLGYNFSERFSVELGRQHYDAFTVTASLPVDYNISRSGVIQGRTVVANMDVNLYAAASERLSLTTTTLELMYKVIQEDRVSVFTKLGVVQGEAKITSEQRYTYGYNSRVCVDQDCLSGHYSFVEQRNNSSSRNGLIPLVSLGVEYDLNKATALRMQYGRLGAPSVYIEAYTLGMLVRF